MSIITISDCKLYCRQTSSAEDGTFTLLLAKALATVQRYTGVPAAKESMASIYYDQARTIRLDRLVSTLWTSYPLDVSTVTITDRDGNVLDPSTYDTYETASTGFIHNVPGNYFDNGPYAIAAKRGLDQHPDYAAVIEPILNGILLDLVADMYQRRNPGAAAESEGAGASVQWTPDGVPARVLADIQKIAPVMVL
jgi:hypothetical protein